MSVKSVPGCLVTIAPILIGVPLAFLPLPRPHFGALPVVLAFVSPGVAVAPALSPLLPPHALTLNSRATAMAHSAAVAGRSRAVKGLKCIALLLLVLRVHPPTTRRSPRCRRELITIGTFLYAEIARKGPNARFEAGSAGFLNTGSRQLHGTSGASSPLRAPLDQLADRPYDLQVLER